MLDTLAALEAAATPAAYLAAVQALDPFLPPADWAALPLTPAHLTAALRYFLWYRPEAGFDLAPLAAMRQQLTELEARTPNTTTPMTLALHDQLLQAHELLPGKLPDHTTQELRQRYYNVLDEVEHLSPPPGAGPRWPAPGTPARATLQATFEAAEALLQSFAVGGSPHLLRLVVEQLAARFPQQFRQHLLALTATEQLFFLYFFDFSAQPALLRELAGSPHKPVRQQATRLLRKLGL